MRWSRISYFYSCLIKHCESYIWNTCVDNHWVFAWRIHILTSPFSLDLYFQCSNRLFRLQILCSLWIWKNECNRVFFLNDRCRIPGPIFNISTKIRKVGPMQLNERASIHGQTSIVYVILHALSFKTIWKIKFSATGV